MRLIYFQGLNCYYECIICIAGYYGLEPAAAFDSLWSETDFKYDPYRKAYLTKRLLQNLSAMGAVLEMLDCSRPETTDASLSQPGEKEPFLVGMDAFYIPWNPLFGIHHGPHYFAACHLGGEKLLCQDPTYEKRDMEIECRQVRAYSFDISRIRYEDRPGGRKEGDREISGIGAEARKVSGILPDIRSKLLQHINETALKDMDKTVLLARYVDAMIGNRRMYGYYLREYFPEIYEKHIFSRKKFFSEWSAVKNGILKAAVSRDSSPVLMEVSAQFHILMDEEAEQARLLQELPGPQQACFFRCSKATGRSACP